MTWKYFVWELLALPTACRRFLRYAREASAARDLLNSVNSFEKPIFFSPHNETESDFFLIEFSLSSESMAHFCAVAENILSFSIQMSCQLEFMIFCVC